MLRAGKGIACNKRNITQQCSVTPACQPQGCPGELSLREEASSSALCTSPALLYYFLHFPVMSTSSQHSHSPLHACPHLQVWDAIHIHGGFVSPGVLAESNMRALLVCGLLLAPAVPHKHPTRDHPFTSHSARGREGICT